MPWKSDSHGELNPFSLVFFFALLIAVLGVASRCSADARCVGGEVARGPMQRDGVDGYWLRSDFFHCLLIEYQASENLGAQVATLERLRVEDAATMKRYRTHVELEERATNRAHEALKLHIDAASNADAWHRSPVVGFAAGVLLTSVAVIAIGSAIK